MLVDPSDLRQALKHAQNMVIIGKAINNSVLIRNSFSIVKELNKVLEGERPIYGAKQAGKQCR